MNRRHFLSSLAVLVTTPILSSVCSNKKDEVVEEYILDLSTQDTAYNYLLQVVPIGRPHPVLFVCDPMNISKSSFTMNMYVYDGKIYMQIDDKDERYMSMPYRSNKSSVSFIAVLIAIDRGDEIINPVTMDEDKIDDYRTYHKQYWNWKIKQCKQQES